MSKSVEPHIHMSRADALSGDDREWGTIRSRLSSELKRKSKVVDVNVAVYNGTRLLTGYGYRARLPRSK